MIHPKYLGEPGPSTLTYTVQYVPSGNKFDVFVRLTMSVVGVCTGSQSWRNNSTARRISEVDSMGHMRSFLLVWVSVRILLWKVNLKRLHRRSIDVSFFAKFAPPKRFVKEQNHQNSLRSKTTKTDIRHWTVSTSRSQSRLVSIRQDLESFDKVTSHRLVDSRFPAQPVTHTTVNPHKRESCTLTFRLSSEGVARVSPKTRLHICLNQKLFCS